MFLVNTTFPRTKSHVNQGVGVFNANSEHNSTQYKSETLRQKLHTHSMRKNILNQTFRKRDFGTVRPAYFIRFLFWPNLIIRLNYNPIYKYLFENFSFFWKALIMVGKRYKILATLLKLLTKAWGEELRLHLQLFCFVVVSWHSNNGFFVSSKFFHIGLKYFL